MKNDVYSSRENYRTVEMVPISNMGCDEQIER